MSGFTPSSIGVGSQSNFNQSFASPMQSQFGGGFINSSPGTGFGASPDFSQATQQRKRDTQSLLPVTIKQLIDAAPGQEQDARIKIDGKELAQITIVGVIIQANMQPTNVNYMICDGSGKIDVKIYIDSEDDSSARHSQWREGMYVRVIGNYRVFNGNVSVIGFQLIPVTDFNEITFHLLQVISCHLKNTKSAPQVAPQGNRLNFSSPAPQVGGNQYGGSLSGGIDEASGFTHVQKQVMGIFNQDRSDAGVHIESVYKALPHIPNQDILKAIEFMSAEGHLYSTIDERHFKSTDADS